jgi:FAD/FMN-containing dehydrogenase
MSQDALSTQIGAALRGRLKGEVLAERSALTPFSTDQSIYQLWPLVVVVPADVEDVVEVVRFAREEGLPLTPRGGGTSTAGSSLGTGIVLAFRRGSPLNRILDFGGDPPRVTAEPALLHDDLQKYLRERGYYLPADPSSGNICLLGGNIATKASGPHAFRHGSIDRYLLSLQFVTAEGDVVDTADERTIPRRIRDAILALRADVLADNVGVGRLRARQEMKIASGYNLFTFLRHERVGDFVAQLLIGSVGTLGVVTRATLRAEPYVPERAMTLLYFRHLDEAGEAVVRVKSLQVAAIEIINYSTIAIIRERDAHLAVPDGEAHMLVVEYEGPQRHEQIARVEQIIRERGYEMAWPPITEEGAESQAEVWKVRKGILPMVLSYRRDRKAFSLVNDVGVDEVYLAPLIRDVEAIFARHGLQAAIYGHAGSGNLHLRPLFDPADPDLPQLLQRVAGEVYEAVFRYGGTITAEHGMGRVRAPFLEREWGPVMVGYMRRIKEAFDPAGLLNPGAMFPVQGLTENMRGSEEAK